MTTTAQPRPAVDWTPRHDQAYRALQAAAERVGAHQWALQRRKGRRRYTPTPGHNHLVQVVKALTAGEWDPEQAMTRLSVGEGAEELGKARRWEAAQRKAEAARADGGEGGALA